LFKQSGISLQAFFCLFLKKVAGTPAQLQKKPLGIAHGVVAVGHKTQ
jgi:hypothetical protein